MNKKTESTSLAFAEEPEYNSPKAADVNHEQVDDSALKETWRKCYAYLSSLLSPDDITNWIDVIQPKELIEQVSLTLWVPSQYHYDILEERFPREIDLMLKSYVGASAQLYIDFPTLDVQTPEAAAPNTSAEVTPELLSLYQNQLNKSFRFDTFYESDSNRFARKMAESVAIRPGQAPTNLLFIHGPSGVGKTHLSQAIGARIQELHPDHRVCYVSCGRFETQYSHDARYKDRSVFLSYYQQVDVLIIDDIQGLVGKTKTQNAFFEIFNHLYLLGKQIVLTSDMPPAEIRGIEHRIITRLQSSIMVGLESPDLELRRKIIRTKTQENNIHIDEEVSEYIAENMTHNIRELDGVLKTLIMHAQVSQKPITLALARKVMSASIEVEEPAVSFDEILTKVAQEFELDRALLYSQSRRPSITLPKQVAMYLAKHRTELSYANIAAQLRLKNHTTVMHGVRAIPKKMLKDPALKEAVERIESRL